MTVRLAVGVIVLMLAGCSSQEHDAVIATVGGHEIRLSEFMKAYKRNAAVLDSTAADSTAERNKLLDLLVKYHLKLLDARDIGLDHTLSYRNEVDQYSGVLASSYLTQREVVEPGMRRLYEQRLEEIRASHIMLKIPHNATAADSAAVYARADSLIALLKAGASFDSLAEADSQDPSAKQNHGDVYYFTAGQMVPQFEDAAYALKKGEISPKPVLTRYGYHIIKVTDRRKSRGEIRCSHIMIRFDKRSPSPADTLAAYQKIKELQDSLAQGVSFAALAERHSGDPGSAARGGDLGWFSRRHWVEPFDEAAFNLKVGELSGIVRSPYGYHLIKCTGERPPESYEKAKPLIEDLYQKLRYKTDYAAYLSGLRKTEQYRENDSVAAALQAVYDSTKNAPDSTWMSSISPALGKRTLMAVPGTSITVDSLAVLISTRPDFTDVKYHHSPLNSAIDKISEELLFATRAKLLMKTDPEFAGLMTEYSNGLLLYEVEQQRVWNKAVVSDSMMRVYFAEHRDRYRFPERVHFTQIRSSTPGAAERVRDLLEEGRTFAEVVTADSLHMHSPAGFNVRFARRSAAIGKDAKAALSPAIDQMKFDKAMRVVVLAFADTVRGGAAERALQSRRVDAIAEYLTRASGWTGKPIEKLVERTGSGKENSAITVTLKDRVSLVRGGPESFALPDTADQRARRADSLTVGGYSAPFRHGADYVIVRLDSVEPPRPMTFEEATGEVASACQELESKRVADTWMATLRRQFPVVEHKDVLEEAFEKKP